MNTVLERQIASTYSAKNMAKPVNFHYAMPTAKSVNLVGDFNDWNPDSLPMERQVDGWWSIQLPLTHGHHHYLFLVDGTPKLDPQASGTVQVERHAKVSLIAVS